MTQKLTQSTQIGALPVSISIEFDNKQISIEELSQLTLGKVMRFSEKAPDKVRLYANRQHFADATLIMVDNKVAVRIDNIVSA